MSKLYILPTPIGNLKDITLRTLEVMREADSLLAEDTRVSSKLLKAYEISKKMTAFHSHNEHKETERIIKRLQEGEVIALLSDAGTPGISDPGFLLVKACAEAGIPVETLPGPTAFVPALVNSGLPCDKFCFEGFLPQKKGRQKRIAELAEEPRTIIFYESPYRLVKALQQMAEVFGEDRRASVSREISKIYEETFRGTLAELIKHFSSKDVKGEIVLVVEGKATKSKTSRKEVE